MIQEITVRHHVHNSDRTYDAVVAAFREAVGSVEEGFDQAAAAVSSRESFECRSGWALNRLSISDCFQASMKPW